eukprot:1148904-Pelagomonas_calceolata.AAC.5
MQQLYASWSFKTSSVHAWSQKCTGVHTSGNRQEGLVDHVDVHIVDLVDAHDETEGVDAATTKERAELHIRSDMASCKTVCQGAAAAAVYCTEHVAVSWLYMWAAVHAFLPCTGFCGGSGPKTGYTLLSEHCLFQPVTAFEGKFASLLPSHSQALVWCWMSNTWSSAWCPKFQS